jgi:UDP-N-acetylglucosamine 2-epimerase (non-hydrolysing)
MKIILVAGARPNFMKIAPLITAMEAYNRKIDLKAIDYILVHTGQHYDINMSRIFFEDLGIPEPDINLGVGSASHAVQTANVMIHFEQVCLQEKPDWVVVVGDVNSTMACTLVASKLDISVAHVEAGLRSFDRTMPEEINRLVTDALADLLLTPSADGDENLIREGIPLSKIRRVGNIMIDTLVSNLQRARSRNTHHAMGLNDKNFVYVTLHRPSNVDHAPGLGMIMDNLTRLSERLPVIFPVHPRTRKMLQAADINPAKHNGFHIIDPVGYLDSICLAENARFVLTDSGGLQEETTFFQTPCLTLRPNTERPVTITEGSNRLTNPERLAEDIEEVLSARPRIGRIPELWDGKTAERIVEILISQPL